MKIKKTKLISLFLLLVLELNYLLPPQVFAQAPPPVTQSSQTPSGTLPIASFPAVFAINPSFPSLDTSSQQLQTSAYARTSPVVQKLAKKLYRSDEDVSVSIANTQDDKFNVSVFDAKGQKADVAVAHMQSGNGITYDVSPRAQFRPGKYKLVVTDAAGKSSGQDFSWGVLAINTDRSIYLPGQTADISMAVLDDVGNMVCDATLDLKITTASAAGAVDDLSTANGKITVNPQCQSHKFSLQPDYEAKYVTGSPGTYTMTLTAQTKNGTESINDQLIVQNSVPFDVQRVSATRVYPPNDYPVQLNITANRDFSGTVTETVPDSFTITSASDSASSSYNNLQTLYLDPKTDPAERMVLSVGYSHVMVPTNNSGKVLGASINNPQLAITQTNSLLLPFSGSFPVTEGFGTEQTDPELRAFYARYGLSGHDGIDFGLPVGTPIRSVDSGVVLLAGAGDYGITIIIQHSWGKSYYGHLSQVLVSAGQTVNKGQPIGISGNTGEATGPHLHFGMKPDKPDMTNGYYGKIDPMPYFGLADNAQTANGGTPGQIPLNPPLVKGETGGTNATASAGVLGININPATVATSSSPVTAPQTVTSSIEQPNFRTFASQIRTQALRTPTTTNENKVKVLTWNVTMKKGEKVTLGYNFKGPQVSPQFYLLGPLRFYANNSTIKPSNNDSTMVFQETRQWQIAGDAIGVPWYNYNWQYRKQITIDHTKVVPSYPNATFMESGTDATQDFSFYSSTFSGGAGAAVTSDATLANTGPRSIKSTANNPNISNFVTPADSFNTSAGRLSFYVYFGTMPTHGDILEVFEATNTTESFGIGVNTNNKVNDACGNASPMTLSTGQWYRIAVSYSVTSTTVNQLKTYINGSLQNTCTNATLAVANPSRMRMGDMDNTDANTSVNFDDIYVDNGSDLSDPVAIQVTSKLPITNGTTNNMTTNGTPTGDTVCTIGTHCEWVNELPLKTVEFLSGFSSAVENFGIQGASAGDVDISSSTLIADEAWIDAQRAGTCGTAATITNNGANTAITLTTSYAMYTSIAAISSYPSNSATVGVVGCSSSSKATDLAEAGMLFAYTPTTPNQTLSNFPVLVSLPSDSDLAANAATSSGILFTDQTGQTKLDREIEKFNQATGELEAWVRVPTLSTTTDTIIYMYYGNAAGAETNATGVWDSNYAGVWHLQESGNGTAGEYKDSTSNANNGQGGAGGGTVPTKVTNGIIANGEQFNGTADLIDVGTNASMNLNTGGTIEAWEYHTGCGGGGFGRIIDRSTDTGGGGGYALQSCDSPGQVYAEINSNNSPNFDSSANSTPANHWSDVVWTFDGTNHTFFIDGVLDTRTAHSQLPGTGTIHVRIGNYSGGTTRAFQGTLDEIRLSNIIRSAGWIGTEFNNEATPSAFFTLGSTDFPSGPTQETTLYAPTMDQVMRGGKWFCPQTAVTAFPNATTCLNNSTNPAPGKQPYVF